MSEQVTKNRFLQFSTFDIKVIGLVLMVVDHFHQTFTPLGAPGWLDWFGPASCNIILFYNGCWFFIYTQ